MQDPTHFVEAYIAPGQKELEYSTKPRKIKYLEMANKENAVMGYNRVVLWLIRCKVPTGKIK
jgi:hypothetical protein